MSSLKELRSQARDLGVRGYSTANKAKLMELLANHVKETELIHGKVAEEQPAPVHVPAPVPTPAPTPAPVKTQSKPQGPSTFEVKQVALVPPKTEAQTTTTKNRKANPWLDFLSDYCKEHGCTRKEAMSKKAEYEARMAKLTSAK